MPLEHEQWRRDLSDFLASEKETLDGKRENEFTTREYRNRYLDELGGNITLRGAYDQLCRYMDAGIVRGRTGYGGKIYWSIIKEDKSESNDNE